MGVNKTKRLYVDLTSVELNRDLFEVKPKSSGVEGEGAAVTALPGHRADGGGEEAVQ